MSDDASVLKTIKSQTLAVIAEITANPRPSYWIDDQRVYWQEYLKQLQATVAWVDRQLASAEPFELHSQGHTP